MAYREVFESGDSRSGSPVAVWSQSQRQIATGTGLSRATVRRYITAALGAGLTRDGPVSERGPAESPGRV